MPLPWCSKLGLFLPNYMRYRSIRPKASSRALFVSTLPLTVLVNAILILAGSLFCFVHFYGCDPHKAAMVANKNQIGIYWLHSILSAHLPNISGVIFACIVYHAIVQHSLGISLIAQTLNEEVLFRDEDTDTATITRKLLGRVTPVLVGAASIPYSAVFQYSRNTMLSLFFVFNNSLNSPILGLFLLSMFNPYANFPGAMAAFILSVGLNCWLAIGSLVFSRQRPQEFDHHTELCANASAFQVVSTRVGGNERVGFSESSSSSSLSHHRHHHHHTHNELYPKNDILYLFYSIAPIWYCILSVLFCILVGTVLSFVYSLVKSRSLDVDHEFRHDRRKYLFYYRWFRRDNF